MTASAASAGRNGSSSHDLGMGLSSKKHSDEPQEVTKQHVEEAKADLERALRSPEARRRLKRGVRRCVSDVEDETKRIESGAYKLPKKEEKS
jgi:hypothetical protein